MAIDKADDKLSWGRLILDEVVDYAKGEAVSHLTGGWVDLDEFGDDGNEQEDDRQRPAEKRESFNERLERELAKLSEQQTEPASQDVRTLQDLPQPPQEIAPIWPEAAGPASRPALQPSFRARPQGFGRKTI